MSHSSSKLSECRVEKAAEGVMQFSFVVEAKDAPGHLEEYQLKRGSTENSYVLFDPIDGLEGGSAGVLLVDVPEQHFSEAFFEKFMPFVKRLEGLIVTSVNVENAPVVSTLIQERSKLGAAPLKVYCSTSAQKIIKNIIDDKEIISGIDFVEITDDSYVPIPLKDTLAHRPHLDVVETANPRFPDSMGVFDERTGMLFSGKFFSAHVALKEPGADPTWKDYVEDWHHFLDCSFFTSSAQVAVRRIFQIAADNCDSEIGLKSADVTSLAPRHGPMVRTEAWKLMCKYEAWLHRKLSAENEGHVLILFASAYGNTTTLAKSIQRGIEATGVKTVMMNAEFCSADDIKKAYTECDGLALGSPTLGGQMPTQMKEALGVILNAAQQGNKESTSVRKGGSSVISRVPCGVFGSYGWSGEAVDELFVRLRDGGFEFAFDPVRCKFKPTEEVLGEAEAAGTRLAQKINDDRRAREQAIGDALQKSSGAQDGDSGLRKAFGQIINSSCVLTMVPEEGKPAVRLPVSWVSQASFTPPGLMIALNKQTLESFVNLPMEEQLIILFEKYDKDGGGTIDREEVDPMLDELFGFDGGSVAGDMLRAQKEEAWKVLDADGSGAVDTQEFVNAATSGPLAELLAQQRRFTSMEALLSSCPATGCNRSFTLSMLPVGMSASDAQTADLEAKKQPKNGCPAIKGATSYLECYMEGLVNAGGGTVLYALVDAGEVLDESANTELLRADHVPIEWAEVPPRPPRSRSSEIAMAGLGAAGATTRAAASRSTFVGSVGAAARGEQKAGVRRRAVALKEPQVLSQEQSWTGLTPGKEYRLQTCCQEVAENTRTIRSLDWDRDRFDIEFSLSNGTTYNSYTIKGADKTALIDASHRKFESLFFEALEAPDGGGIDLATLDYIIVSHTEPDHSGLIEAVLLKAKEKGNTHLTVVGSKTCITFLKDLVHIDFDSRIVKGGDQIDLGGGHILDFVIAPNLHWPDTMFTYDNKTQIMYTCDAFGMHYCSDQVTDKESVETLEPHYKLYYNCLMRPNARSVLIALKKAGDLPGEVAAIATGHGPMLCENKDVWMDKYQGWSDIATKKLGPSVCILWVSRHGESERLAQAFAYSLTQQDILVEMHDLNAIDAFEVAECCMRNQVIVVFTPPQGDSTAQRNLSSALTSCNVKENKFVVCASGGEKDEPVDALVSRWVQSGFQEALPGLKTQAGSDAKNLAFFEGSGLALAKALLSKTKAAAKDKLDAQTMQALGKMGGGRYIISANKGEIRSGAIATWVMPASSEPPSLAVSVPKDHPLQSLIQVGDTFVVNLLEEGNYLEVFKHFQQDLKPGQDIFEGIATTEVESKGGKHIAVPDACAFITCRVFSRMDASDHVVICGEAVSGQIVRDAPTAANYRKSGAYYS